MHAKVAVVTKPEQLRVERRAVAAPGPREALVRVRECGICGSDLKMLAGKHPVVRPPIVLGHEFYGTVEAVGEGAEVEPGAVVAGFPPIGCGHCFNCRRGLPHLCPDMEFIGGQHPGGLSELLTLPADNLVALHPDVPEDRRVLIEPLAVGVHAARRAGALAGDQVVLIGAGPIGLFTALALRHLGVDDVLLADLSDDRLELARRFGAGTTVNTGEVTLVDHVRDVVRPEGADVVFDCVGLNATAADALAATCKGGRTVLVGLMPQEMRVDGVLLQRGERSLIGVQQYTREDFHAAMAILAAGALPPGEGVTVRYGLDEVAEAFDALKAGRAEALKTVVAL